MTSVLIRGEETEGECHVVTEAEIEVIRLQSRVPRIGSDHQEVEGGKEDSTQSLRGGIALPTH